MTRDRMASSLARPPALRMTWASPSLRPAYLAGSSRASMHVKQKGRVAREEWIEQAKELLAGKPPRAKSDKARAKDQE